MNGLRNNPVLTPLQVEVLAALFAEEWFRERFVLVGGTALSAFYLEHRLSEDLDLFTYEPFPRGLAATLETTLAGVAAVRTVRSTPGFLRLEADGGLKLDFVSDTPVRFGIPRSIEGIRVDSEENIAVGKVCAILGRLEPKDYVDLFFLIRDRGYVLADLLRKGAQKDAGLEPFIWAQLIGDAEAFTVLPRMLKPLELEELKAFYRKLRKDLVRSLKP